jgi:CspA family cold shock protein
MEQGIIKRILTVRNYGFISIDSGELFFHKSVVEGTAFEELQEGQAVEYECEDGSKAPKATVVRATDGESQTVENESEDSPEGSQDVAERAIDRIEGQTAEHESEGGSEASRNTAEHESEDDTSTNRTVKYVVAVFSRRNTWREKNPDAPHLGIRYLGKKRFARIADGKPEQGDLPKKFRGLVKSDPRIECETLLEAWEAAFELQKRLDSEKRKADLPDLGEPCCRVYVFEMKPTVIDDDDFAEMNLSLPTDDKGTCVYVGQTSNSPEVRYEQHRSEIHVARTGWGRDYFLDPFELAYREDLLLEFQETGEEFDRLNTYEALKQELALRKWLQKKKGIAAYSK